MEAEIGNDQSGVIAVDDFSIQDGPCQPKNTTTTTTRCSQSKSLITTTTESAPSQSSTPSTFNTTSERVPTTGDIRSISSSVVTTEPTAGKTSRVHRPGQTTRVHQPVVEQTTADITTGLQSSTEMKSTSSEKTENAEDSEQNRNKAIAIAVPVSLSVVVIIIVVALVVAKRYKKRAIMRLDSYVYDDSTIPAENNSGPVYVNRMYSHDDEYAPIADHFGKKFTDDDDQSSSNSQRDKNS